MPKYLIEREIPGLGKLSYLELQEIARKSNDVICKLGPDLQWVQSYCTGDKMYCVYISPNEELIRKHARIGGFPVDRVSLITGMIDPTTGGK